MAQNRIRQKKIVQFFHPGSQYEELLVNKRIGKKTKDSCLFTKTNRLEGIKLWNTGNHKRKFIRMNGEYINDASKSVEGEIAFWGEWEPESYFSILENNKNKKDMPLHIHQPFYSKHFKSNMQNTDPFVYGDSFLYSCCQQNVTRKSERFKNKGIFPTTLQDLDIGSLILFGSRIGNSKTNYQFALDTVFVVSNYIEFSLNNISVLKNSVTPTFYECVLSKIQTNNSNSSNNVYCTLYFGETFSNKTKGPYSFIICKPFNNIEESIFSRLVLDINKYSLSQPGRNTGFKDTILEEIRDKNEFINCCNDSEIIEKYWSIILSEISASQKGLKIGVRVKEPKQTHSFNPDNYSDDCFIRDEEFVKEIKIMLDYSN
ncbi:hypothetical protein [Neobacillus drentensis]|uniref:hypothetical protein n=1 Tax=Neobacillus drentensis TaxID=220684 RepID=UPI0030001B35